VSRDKRFRPRPLCDHGPPERWQHTGRTLEYTEDAGIFAARASEEHVLDKLVLMHIVDEPAREAGLKLRHDYLMARIEERIAASYSSVRVGGDPQRRLERNAAQEAAYQRWRSGLAATPVPTRDVLVHVCCVGHAPALAQLARLVLGLKHLAKYYGLAR
jgi:hypothetical protein